MDTIYNINELPIGIYSSYKNESIEFPDKSIYILHSKSAEDKRIKIWSNAFIDNIITLYGINECFIIYSNESTIKINTVYITPNGESVIKKHLKY